MTRQFYLLLSIVFIGYFGISLPYTIFGPLFLQPENYAFFASGMSQQERIVWLGITMSAYPFGLFFGAPVLGSLSDRFGRKKILVITLFLTAIGCTLTGISLSIGSLSLLVISRFITGISEGNIAIARAMVQDFSKTGFISLHKGLGGINAVGSIAYLLGPLFGGLFSSSELYHGFDPSLPFYLASIVTLLVQLLSLLLLKETKAATPKKFIFNELNALGYVTRICKIPALQKILLCSTIFTIAVDLFYEFFPLFLASPLGFSPLYIAYINGVLCIALAFGNGYMPQAIAKFFSNKPVILAGSVLFSIAVSLFSFQDGFGELALFISLAGLFLSMATVNYTVELSGRADGEIQGEVFGVLMGLRTLADALICLVGAGCMLSSSQTPLLLASAVALFSTGYFAFAREKVAIKA